MKKMLYFLLLSCAGCISLFTLYSCQRPDGGADEPCVNTTENYYLSDAQKKTLPYTGFDTISMVSNLGDTLHCIGTGKEFFETYEFVPYIKPSCSNNGTEKYYEAYKIVFVDSIKNKTIQIAHYKQLYIGAFDIRANVISITFKKTVFYIGDFQLSDPNSQRYIGSMKLNNLTYQDISKAYFEKFKDETYSFALLNKTYGLLQINLTPNEIWTIVN